MKEMIKEVSEIRKIIILLTMMMILFLEIGCTAHAQPVISESEYLTNVSKIKGSAELYVTEEFKTYTITKTNVMDLKRWEFEIGPCAVDAFKYALASKFEKVDVKLGKPSFPLQREDLLVIVEPTISTVGTHFPIVFKFETYRVVMIFRVRAYDKTGGLLFDEVIEGVGKRRGSIGYESPGHAANPIAAKLAIKDAADKSILAILKSLKWE